MCRFCNKTAFILLILILIANVIICLLYEVPLRNSSVLLIVAVIILIMVRTKANWFALVALCLYGMYDLFYVGRTSSDVLTMDFLYPVEILIQEEYNVRRLKWFVGLLPLLFYLQFLIILVSKTGRREYGIIGNK